MGIKKEDKKITIGNVEDTITTFMTVAKITGTNLADVVSVAQYLEQRRLNDFQITNQLNN